MCNLEEGVFYSFDLTKIIFHGDKLTNRFSEVIGRVVEAGLHNYWIFLCIHLRKLLSWKIAIIHPLDGYYIFKVYHVQPGSLSF